MKRLILLLALTAPGCALFQRPLPPPPEVPATGPEVGLDVRFAPAGGPTKDLLYVCGLVDGGTFWCMEYDNFQEQLKAWRVDHPNRTASK